MMGTPAHMERLAIYNKVVYTDGGLCIVAEGEGMVVVNHSSPPSQHIVIFMQQTLCYIPETVFGFPLFGWGIGLELLCAAVIAVHAYQYAIHRTVNDIGSSLALLGIGGVMLVFVVPNLAEPGLGIPIRGYGFCLLIGILAALFLVVHLAKQKNIVAEQVYSLCFWVVIAGIIGARLFYVTEYWREMIRFDHSGQLLFRESLFSVLNIAQGGLVIFGAILGGTLGALIFMLRYKMPVLQTFDALAPGVMLGIAIGRIGCLLNGCCFGSVSDVSWGIVFPAGSPVHVHQIAHGDVFFCGLKFEETNIDERKMLAIAEVEVNSDAALQGLKPKMLLWNVSGRHEGGSMVWEVRTCHDAAELLAHLQRTSPNENIQFDFYADSLHSDVVSYRHVPRYSEVLPVHPTQIYSSLIAALICGMLLFLGRTRCYRQREGLVLASFMILYSMGRFFIEKIRIDEEPFLGTGLTVSQNVCIVFFLTGIALFTYIYRKHPKK